MAYTCHKNYKLVPQCQFNYVVLHSSYHYCCNTSKLTFFFRRRAKIKVLTGAISAIQRAPQLASLSKTLATQSKAGLKRLGPFRCSLLASMQPNRHGFLPIELPDKLRAWRQSAILLAWGIEQLSKRKRGQILQAPTSGLL